MIFAVGTPVLAATLATIGGVSQTFLWGAAWQDMVITATRLEKEYDRLRVTPADQRNYVEEMEAMNGYVLVETQGFFERLFGSLSADRTNAA